MVAWLAAAAVALPLAQGCARLEELKDVAMQAAQPKAEPEPEEAPVAAPGSEYYRAFGLGDVSVGPQARGQLPGMFEGEEFELLVRDALENSKVLGLSGPYQVDIELRSVLVQFGEVKRRAKIAVSYRVKEVAKDETGGIVLTSNYRADREEGGDDPGPDRRQFVTDAITRNIAGFIQLYLEPEKFPL